MKIGIDISVLQTAHRKRGIGYTLINFIKCLPKKEKEEHSFVFYHYPLDTHTNPLEILDLSGYQYETRVIEPVSFIKRRLPGRLGMLTGLVNQLIAFKTLYFGDTRVSDFSDVDRFLQFNQNQPLPAKRKVNSALIIYDLIPYVMESDYLWSYSTARSRDRSILGSLKIHFIRKRYLAKNRFISRKASKLIAISHHTKEDFVKYIGTPEDKIDVCHLGVDGKQISKTDKNINIEKYVDTSWGPMLRLVDLTKEKYLLYIGGADPRRRLPELIAAFNNLRARGVKLKLVLAGDTMTGPFHIPNHEVHQYFKHTSYIDDIIFLGFVSDDQRDWLYNNAVAFVYPSVYEGFGLPIVEAMQYTCPIITFNNSSIAEVGGDAVIYAEDFADITRSVTEVMNNPRVRKKYLDLGRKQVKKFDWPASSKKILNLTIQ